jgi:hypothetical protein
MVDLVTLHFVCPKTIKRKLLRTFNKIAGRTAASEKQP